MESDLVIFLAWIGFVCLYTVTGAFVGRAIANYTRRDCGDEGSLLLGVIGGFFWPAGVTVLIFGLLIRGMIYSGVDTQSSEPYYSSSSSSQRKSETEEDDADDDDEEEEEEVCKFKVGELVTGAEGNPSNAVHLYPGCVCRVIELDEYDSDRMKVILVDHIDKEAQKDSIGDTYWGDAEDFAPVPKPVKAKRAKRKSTKKAVPKKPRK